MISLVLLVLISIPLATIFVNSVQESSTRQTIQRVLTSELNDLPDLALAEFDFDDDLGQLDVIATLYARQELGADTAQRLNQELEQALQRPVHLQIVSIPVVEIDVGPR